MAFTSQQISVLEQAIAEGALIVQYQDKKVEYRSLDEMIRLLSLMRQSLLPAGQGDGGIVYASYDRGVSGP